MNVLFVSSMRVYCRPEKPLHGQSAVLLGISYISSSLKAAGHATRLLVLTPETPKEVIDRTIRDFRPRLVCFTAFFSEYPFIAGIAGYIRQQFPDLYLLGGGPHISLNADAVIRDCFDALCIGEGEQPTLELVQQLEAGQTPSGIRNLWIKHGADVEKCPPRDFLQDLDSLPFPDRDMWQEWIEDPNTKPCVLLGRGCPFNCTYCCNHALRKLTEGEYVRFRSTDNVIAELRQLTERLRGVRQVYFEVETIGANLDFAKHLCERLQEFNAGRAEPITFSVNLRVTPGCDYSRLFAAFKEAHFTLVNIGLESGSPRVRSEVLNRHYSNDDLLRAVERARQYGLKVALFVLLGLPGETRQDFQETVECTRRCQPDECFLSIFTPYPGTVLYTRCEEMGLLDQGLDMRLERRRAILDLPGFSRRQIQIEYLLFPYKVYKGRKPLPAVLKRVAKNWVRSSYVPNAVYKKLLASAAGRRFGRFIKRKR